MSSGNEIHEILIEKLKISIMPSTVDLKRHKKLPKKVRYGYLIFLFYCFSILVPYIVMAGMNPKKSCGDTKYYEPYVTVYLKIRGKEVANALPGGFLDTSKFCDKFICLNGPVMIYENAEDTTNAIVVNDVDDSVTTLTKRNTPDFPCTPGRNGVPPGVNCNSIGSGSGTDGTLGIPTTTEVSLVSPVPDPEPFVDITTTAADMESTTESNEVDVDPVMMPDTTTTPDSYEYDPDPISPTGNPRMILPSDWKACTFKKAVLEVFDHKCFKLNQRPKRTKMQVRIITTPQRPGTGDCNLEDVIGRKIYGIKMLTKKDDYRNADLTQFVHPDFEYHNKSCPDYVGSDAKGHSFASIGNKDQFDFCHSKKSTTGEEFIRLHMEKKPRSPTICLYAPGMKDRFDNYMHGQPKDKFKWGKCPSKFTAGMGTGNKTNIYDFGHFAINSKDGMSIKLNIASSGTHEVETTTETDPLERANARSKSKTAKKNYAVVSDSNCTRLPVLDFLKCAGKDKTDEPCKLLSVSLNTGTDDDEHLQIKMRRQALNLIDSIYDRICEHVPSSLPLAATRILLFYMEQARMAGGRFPFMKNETWRFLLSDLQTCFDHAEQMEFLFDEVSTDGDDKDDDTDMNGRSIAKNGGKKIPDDLDDGDSESTDSKRKTISVSSETIIPPVAMPISGPMTSADLQEPNIGDALGQQKRDDLGDSSPGSKAAKKSHELADGALDELELQKRESPAESTPKTEETTLSRPIQENKNDSGSVLVKRSKDFLSEPEFSFFDDLERQKREVVANENSLPRAVRDIDDEGDGDGIPMVPTNVQVKHKVAAANFGRSVTNMWVNLFYYEEAAELEFDFNIVLDAHWKIFATVLGYCNKFYPSRKAETFPRLYNTYFEDILEPIQDTWTASSDNDALEVIVSEVTDPVTMEWLNHCLEASYIVSDSITFRPPRPLTFKEGSEMVTNYFEKIPNPEFFIPDKMGRAMARMYEEQMNSADSEKKDAAEAKGRTVAHSLDPNCQWSCNSVGECHKNCGENTPNISKGVDILHHPNGKQTFFEKDVSDGLDSSEYEYGTIPHVKKAAVDTVSDDDTEPRKSRTVVGTDDKIRQLQSEKNEKLSSPEKRKQNLSHLVSLARNLKSMKHLKDKDVVETNSNAPEDFWHTGTVRNHVAKKSNEKLDPIVQQEEEKGLYLGKNEDSRGTTRRKESKISKKQKKSKILKSLSKKENQLTNDFEKFFKEHDHFAKSTASVDKSKRPPPFHVMAKKLPTFDDSKELVPLEVTPASNELIEKTAVTTLAPRLATTIKVTGDKTPDGRRIQMRKRGKKLNKAIKKVRHLGYGKF